MNRILTRLSILKAAVREYVAYDLHGLRAAAAWTLFISGSAMFRTTSLTLKAKGLGLLMRLHGRALSPAVDRRILDIVRRELHANGGAGSAAIRELFRQTKSRAAAHFRKNGAADPRRLIGTRILVVKAFRPGERGVAVIDYSNVFALVAEFFDLRAICERYSLVLEPSWAGVCTPEILLFNQFGAHVIVETAEPRDQQVLQALESNLLSAPIAANWWTNPDDFQTSSRERDIDVIMVASWSAIKRHWRFFRTLRKLRRKGIRLKVALVGYQYDLSRANIESQLDLYGISDQVEIFDRVPASDVAELLARAKVHVLWSRRECANRAIVEAMFADVPIILRKGLTFGFPYNYVNERTGRFAAEGELASAIVEMVSNRDKYSARAWMSQNMTCAHATAVLEDTLKDAARIKNAEWTVGLAQKVSALDAQKYLHASERRRFTADYAYLESTLLDAGTSTS